MSAIIKQWIEKGYSVQMQKGDDGWYHVAVSWFNATTWHGNGETLLDAILDADRQIVSRPHEKA